MRAHRFYFTETELTQTVWVHDAKLLNQWLRVFRFRVDQEVVLFDGHSSERLYKLAHINKDGVKLELVTEYVRQVPRRHVYLLWSVLKSDHNDLIVEKATELGVTQLMPIQAERCIKTGFNMERAQRIAIEASEQCGRSDVPVVHDLQELQAAITGLALNVQLLVAHQGSPVPAADSLSDHVGIIIGPEGGWSAAELDLFHASKVPTVGLAQFVLRAETAAITAAAALC